MCRLFGFRARTPGKVDRWLIDSKSSLSFLSHEHRHGWGIGWYENGHPHLHKGTAPAYEDPQFERVARELTSSCVLAHVRRRSVGGLAVEDSHPFAYGRLLFAHNGTVHDFEAVRARVEAAIPPSLRGELRGSTDSERGFLLLLGHLEQLGALQQASLDQLALALARTVAQMRALPEPEGSRHMLTFLVTDGERLVGVRSGEKELWTLARPRASGDGNELESLAVASEPLSPEDAWEPVADGELVGIDGAMRLRRWKLFELLGPGGAA